MEANGSTPHSLVPCSSDETIRFTADFHPTVWGDYFIENYPLPSNLQKSEACVIKRIGELKEEVKSLLKNANDDLQKMELIDALQRLGMAYHFEKEIDEILNQIYNVHIDGESLHVVALHFRLLRQHGYNVPANVFNKFKEVEGGFKATLRNDMKGLLSLYEAAYLGILEEDILDEALNFAKVHLKSMESQTRPPLAAQILDAFEMPLYRRMGRLEAKNYISIYQEDEGQINPVLELAKLDFHMLQSIHREEIRSISMWDIEAANQLEEVSKLYFLNLYNTFKEFEDELAEEGNSYRVDYLKESIKEASRACMEEAKWRDKGYVPPLKEYLTVSTISCCFAVLSCASFVGMGEEATKEAFEWLTSLPRIIKATSSIFRLLNDVASNEFEQERNHVSSAVQCYIKEHGASVQGACEKLLGMIEEEWKILNNECLNMTAMPKSLIMPIINNARTIETMYRKSDSYTHASTTMKDRITLLLVEPISF
uniref:Beta-eudesmol synthase isoform X2 n=1 Tax=Elaeis guineensis var. tenera TaxID=51953 RepID=A0A6J0PCZ2_ELAGV|nr:beta-eudesmol synthase isoform X2 [Elaeis guineensis]